MATKNTTITALLNISSTARNCIAGWNEFVSKRYLKWVHIDNSGQIPSFQFSVRTHLFYFYVFVFNLINLLVCLLINYYYYYFVQSC